MLAVAIGCKQRKWKNDIHQKGSGGLKRTRDRTGLIKKAVRTVFCTLSRGQRPNAVPETDTTSGKNWRLEICEKPPRRDRIREGGLILMHDAIGAANKFPVIAGLHLTDSAVAHLSGSIVFPAFPSLALQIAQLGLQSIYFSTVK